MNKHRTSAAIILIALFGLFSADQAHADFSAPPPQLTTIFEDFSDFEQKFKSGRWDAALRSLDGISTTFKKMLPQLKKDIKADTEAGFLAIMNELKRSVRKKDTEGAQGSFIQLHNFIFALISNYEYKVPPVLSVINKYIAETEEALEKDNYKRVVSEMDEIISLFYYAENYLEGRGGNFRKIEETNNTLKKIRIAGIEKQKQTVQTGLHSLKKMMSELFGK